MRWKDTLFRFISRVLVAHALHACPPGRAKWIAAATGELDSIPGSYESLVWSLGAVWAGYKARVCAMSMAEPQLPKALLTLELLTCFLPSCFLWVWTLRAAADHILQTDAALCLATAASIGPIGLAAFARVIAGGSRSGGRYWSIGLILLAGWLSVVLLLLPCTPLPFRELPWRECVLLVILPLIGAAHYALLESRAQSGDGPGAVGTSW
jgi:hypothetical protein